MEVYMKEHGYKDFFLKVKNKFRNVPMFWLFMTCLKTTQNKKEIVHVLIPSNDYGQELDEIMVLKMNTWLLHISCLEICSFVNMKNQQEQNRKSLLSGAMQNRILQYHKVCECTFLGYLNRKCQSNPSSLFYDLRDFFVSKFATFINSKAHNNLIETLTRNLIGQIYTDWLLSILHAYCITFSNFFWIANQDHIMNLQRLIQIKDILNHVRCSFNFLNKVCKDNNHPTMKSVKSEEVFENGISFAFEKYVRIIECPLLTAGTGDELAKISKYQCPKGNTNQIHIFVIDVSLEIFHTHYRVLQEAKSCKSSLTNRYETLKVFYKAFKVKSDDINFIIAHKILLNNTVKITANYTTDNLSALYTILEEEKEDYNECFHSGIYVQKLANTWTNVLRECLLGIAKKMSLEEFRIYQSENASNILPKIREEVRYYEFEQKDLSFCTRLQTINIDFYSSNLLISQTIADHMYKDTNYKKFSVVAAASINFFDLDNYTCLALYVVPIIQQICQLRRIFGLRGFEDVYGLNSLDNFVTSSMIDSVLMAWQCITAIINMSLPERKFFNSMSLLVCKYYCRKDEAKERIHLSVLRRYTSLSIQDYVSCKCSLRDNDTETQDSELKLTMNNENIQMLRSEIIELQGLNICEDYDQQLADKNRELLKLIDDSTSDETTPNENDRCGVFHVSQPKLPNAYSKLECNCLKDSCIICSTRLELAELIDGWEKIRSDIVNDKEPEGVHYYAQCSKIILNSDHISEETSECLKCECKMKQCTLCCIKSELMDLIGNYINNKLTNGYNENSEPSGSLYGDCKCKEDPYLKSEKKNAILSRLNDNDQDVTRSYQAKMDNKTTQHENPLVHIVGYDQENANSEKETEMDQGFGDKANCSDLNPNATTFTSKLFRKNPNAKQQSTKKNLVYIGIRIGRI